MSTGIDRLRDLDQRRARASRGMRGGWSGLPTSARTTLVVLLLLVLVFLPQLRPPLLTTTDSDWTTTLYTCTVYALAALGLNVVVGMAGLLDLGYVGFYAVGAYSVAVFGSPSSPLAVAWPWLVCVPIAIALAMIAGVILGGPTLRLRGDYLAIVTLGFGEIVRLTAVNTSFLGNTAGISGVPSPPGLGFDALPYYYLGLALVVVIILAVTNLERSRVGRAWVSIREDEDAAELMGVPTFKFKLWAFAIGAAVGGLSGVMYASKYGFVSPLSFPVQTSILFLAAVVVGGAGNKFGVVVGAALVAYLPERFRNFSDWRIFVFGVALIVMSIFRPQGIIPNSRRRQEFEDREVEGEEAVHA